MAPSQLVQELADVIPVVPHAEFALDQGGNSLRRPEIRSVAESQRALRKQLHDKASLLRRQFRWSPRSRFGAKRRLASGSQSVSPPQNAAGVTPDAPSNLMQG
jgi:hypothetical protein